MIINEIVNKIYPFFAGLSIAAAMVILVFFGLSKRKGFKIFSIALTAVSIITALFLNTRSFNIYGDFSGSLFSFNSFSSALTAIILFLALNVLIHISIINFHNDNFIKIMLIFLTGVFFLTVFVCADNFIMIFTCFAVFILAVFQLSSVLNSSIKKGNFSEYSVKNSIIRFYLGACISLLLTFMGYSLIYSSTSIKIFRELLQSDKMSSPLVNAGLFIILASLYVLMFLFPFQSAYLKMQNRTQYSSMQAVWFLYFPAGILMFLKVKDVLYYYLEKNNMAVTAALLVISAISIIGGNIGAIRTQGLRRIMSFLFLTIIGMIILGFAQSGLGQTGNADATSLSVISIVFLAIIYFPLGLFSSELENRHGSDSITHMTGYLRTQKYIGVNILILLLSFGGLIGTSGYLFRFIYLSPFLAGSGGLLKTGPDIGFSILNISSFVLMLLSWLFMAGNMARLIFYLVKRPAQPNTQEAIKPLYSPVNPQTEEFYPDQAGNMLPGKPQISIGRQAPDSLISLHAAKGRFRFSWFLYSYLTFFSIIIILAGILGLLEIYGFNLNFLNFSLLDFNY